MGDLLERILTARVSAVDMARALVAINALPPKDRSDRMARVVCLIELFGKLGHYEVSPRIAAIDWRFHALGRLAGRPELKNGWLRDSDGVVRIAMPVLVAAAVEPLIECKNGLAFEADSFFKRLLAISKDQGHG
jgi:hypothetical protein